MASVEARSNPAPSFIKGLIGSSPKSQEFFPIDSSIVWP
jgi:hypothetical protein